MNPYAWNANANVLYIEQPTGVGFSWASDKNYTSGDDQAASDNRQLLASFLVAFPEYVGRKTYLSGESYAGHYVPQLAMLLTTNPLPGLSLAGFVVGNPSFDHVNDAQNYWRFMCSHGFCSDSTYTNAFTTCNGSFVAPLSPACSAILGTIRKEFVYLNPYNVEGSCDGEYFRMCDDLDRTTT